MDKLISQQAAIDAFYQYPNINWTTLDVMKKIKELPSSEPEAISKWKKEFREYVDSLDIARDDWKGIIEYIDELPSAKQEAPDINVGNMDTTTHDSIPAKTGKNDGDGTSGDCISRRASLEKIRTMQTYKLFAGDDMLLIDQAEAQTELMMLPSAQPDIIRCPDCYYNDGTAYCELHFRNVKAKDFCSWAERRE